MYYKIENKDCEIYNKLRIQREKELSDDKANEALLKDKIPYKWSSFLGKRGQQTLNRTTDYAAFKFDNPVELNPKEWVLMSGYDGMYEPNNKTVSGRKIRDFLRNGLNGNSYYIIWTILGLDRCMGEFSFPFLEICGDVLVLYLDEKQQPLDENIIEITSKEFKGILSNYVNCVQTNR